MELIREIRAIRGSLLPAELEQRGPTVRTGRWSAQTPRVAARRYDRGMAPDDAPSTRQPCSLCGEPAGIRYTDADGEVRWYCLRHQPPPAGMNEKQKAEWATFMAVAAFVTRNKRTPSFDRPDDREFLLSLIPDTPPGSPGFFNRKAELERFAKATLNSQRRIRRMMVGFDILMLPISLPLAAIEWLVRRVVRRRTR